MDHRWPAADLYIEDVKSRYTSAGGCLGRANGGPPPIFQEKVTREPLNRLSLRGCSSSIYGLFIFSIIDFFILCA